MEPRGSLQMTRNPEMTYYTEANELPTNLQITCLKSTSVKLPLPFNLCLGLRMSVFPLNILYICTSKPQTPLKYSEPNICKSFGYVSSFTSFRVKGLFFLIFFLTRVSSFVFQHSFCSCSSYCLPNKTLECHNLYQSLPGGRFKS